MDPIPWTEGLQHVEIDGVQMAVSLRGRTGPPVLLLHGAACTHAMWDPQTEALSEAHRIIAPDLRGHGATRVEDPSRIYSIADHAADLDRLLTRLGVNSVHVVGLSLGGMVAHELAVRYPERVRSVAAVGAPNNTGVNVLHRMSTACLTWWFQRGLRRGGMAWLAGLTARSAPKSRRAETLAYLEEDMGRNTIEEFMRVWHGVLGFRGRVDLPRITAPFLGLAGAKDSVRFQARQTTRLVADGRFELIPHAGHVANRDNPPAVTERLRSWFAEQEQRRVEAGAGEKGVAQ